MEINASWKANTGQDAAAVDRRLARPAILWCAAAGSMASTMCSIPRKAYSARVRRRRRSTPTYPRHVEQVAECIAKVRAFCTLLALADWLVPALRLGRAFALAWDEAKQREGLIDFDDQIRMAAKLLTDSSQAEWIGYKLDRRFDHILVDEAQDTNAAQWSIILDGLTREFFAGEGQRGDRMRTLFVVGDYKQAIFRFQGTSPENFEAARKRVRDSMLGAAVNARSLRANADPSELREWGLDRSFRTAQPVLDFVDKAIAGIGYENIGLERPPEPHKGLEIPGHVALWRPVGQLAGDLDADDEAGEGEAWLSDGDRKLADNIARQVKAWTDPNGPGLLLSKGGERRAGPGDVMVLVRKRGALAGLMVARLHAHGVPVAGVDRLRLGAPLAVQGPGRGAALRRAAVRRSQPRRAAGLAAGRVEPGGSARTRLAREGRALVGPLAPRRAPVRRRHARSPRHAPRPRRFRTAAGAAPLAALRPLAGPPQAGRTARARGQRSDRRTAQCRARLCHRRDRQPRRASSPGSMPARAS